MSVDTTGPETEQVQSQDLPIYSKPTLPDNGQVILLMEEPDFDRGGQMVSAYRLPLSRVVPGGSPQSVVYSRNDPNAGIVVPENAVVPAYVESFGSFNLKRAQASDATTRAKFLIIGTDPNIDNNYLLQSHGFFQFPTVHEYNVGQTYYLSDSAPGGVTNTPPPGIVQPVFYVVDQKTIVLTIGL